MSNIGAVIGWKFNHQAGMTTVDSVITKFPGGIPSQEDQDTWAAEYETWKTVMDEIARLEAEITPRRQREAGSDDAGGSQAGRDWMAAQETLIFTQRAKL